MGQFNLYDYFYNNLLREQDEDEMDAQNAAQGDPSQMAQGQNAASQAPVQDGSSQQSPEDGSPAQQTNMIQAGQEFFSDLRGQTIKSVEFKRSPKDANSWELKVFIEDQQLPFIISSQNGRMRVQNPTNGEVYPLT